MTTFLALLVLSQLNLNVPTTRVVNGKGADAGILLNVNVVGTVPTSGTWFPDGGVIGFVRQGTSDDGGSDWFVDMEIHVSTMNSTSTPLGIGGVFTGSAESLLDAAQIMVTVFSDVASATDGVSMQFSSNGTNWDHIQTFTTTAGLTRVMGIDVMARFYRIVFTNGGTAQGVFRLQSLAKPIPSFGTVTDIGIVPKDGDHSLFTQSIIVGRTTAGGGVYVPVKVTPSGALTAEVTQSTIPWVVSGNVNAVIDGGVVLDQGIDPNGVVRSMLVNSQGAQFVVPVVPNPFVPRCNPVRRTRCLP